VSNRYFSFLGDGGVVPKRRHPKGGQNDDDTFGNTQRKANDTIFGRGALNRVIFWVVNKVDKRHWARSRGTCATLPIRTGGAVALKLRARLNPAGDSWRTPIREVLYPNLGAHVEAFWSAAAPNCARPRRWPLLDFMENAAGERVSLRRRSKMPPHAPPS